MSKPSWRRVREVLEQTLEQPIERRAAFLDRICAYEPNVRREVESLLAEDNGLSSLPRPRRPSPPDVDP